MSGQAAGSADDSAAAPVRLAWIGGDGIGPEVVDAAVRVVDAVCGDRIEWVEAEMGWQTFERTGRALPEATVEILESCAGALFGAVSSPSHPVPGYRSPIVELRRRLDLYANVRPLTRTTGSPTWEPGHRSTASGQRSTPSSSARTRRASTLAVSAGSGREKSQSPSA